jgi:hypothetical protein
MAQKDLLGQRRWRPEREQPGAARERQVEQRDPGDRDPDDKVGALLPDGRRGPSPALMPATMAHDQRFARVRRDRHCAPGPALP